MKILFVNPDGLQFNVSTPEREPLGGIASCMCYLARQLAHNGHNVTLLSNLPKDTSAQLLGVYHLPLATIETEGASFFTARDYDAAIVANCPQLAPHIRTASPKTLNVAWLHVFPNQPAVKSLTFVQAMLDYLVFVSETQRATFRVGTPAHVIGNGIAPAFENMFGSVGELLSAKQNRAIYSSMPFRGLDILVETMERTKAQTSLDIYSSMGTYQAGDEACAALFRRAERSARVRYHGAIGQVMLAKAFRSAAFLAYPSTFPETYCIAAQEAMAAGAKVLSIDYGALKETTMGYADLLPMREGGIIREEIVSGFGVLLEKNEADFQNRPSAWAERMFEQVKAVNRASNWMARAAQWEAFLAPAIARKRS